MIKTRATGRASNTFPLRIAALAVATLLLAASRPAAAGIPRLHSNVVSVHGAAITGTTINGFNAFLGIPYAAPPVGALRWQPPQPPAPFTSLNATKFANHCPQPASPFGIASTTESCLFLNVFTPPGAKAGDDFPVMVWIHGGAFVVGESDDFDPTAFIKRGAIVVTINYRLGALGFLATPGLDAEGHLKVNYGLQDQQAAIRWVQKNIGSFGGSFRRVTIFGESAGGLSVFSQLSSPLAAGTFQRAIIESGAYQLTLPSLSASEASGTAFAGAVGCSTASSSCLRALPVTTLLSKESAMTVPTVDGTLLPQSPGAALASGKFNRVPVLDGSNHDEYRLFIALDFDLVSGPITTAGYAPTLNAIFGPALGPLVAAEYPLASFPSPDLAAAAAVTDAVFACTAFGADISFSQFVPTYAYEFADENAPEDFLPPVSFPYGAAHASEIQFIWGDFNKPNPPLTPQEKDLADTMQNTWVTFAKANGAQFVPPLIPFFPQLGDTLKLVPPFPNIAVTFAADHKCAFWANPAGGPAPTFMRARQASPAFGHRAF